MYSMFEMVHFRRSTDKMPGIKFKDKASPWTVFLFYFLIMFPYLDICYGNGNNFHAPDVGGFEIEEATIQQIQAAFKKGRLTSVALVKFYFHRIEELNHKLHAVIEVNPDALRFAELADAHRLKSEGFVGGLHGIPVLLKDNIATGDKLNTTAGSFALLGSKVPRDAGVAFKLRKAGAIILGKASLSEWANFRSFNAPNGWSARGGQAKNPYVPTADPCGSSTGSAVAVSANMAAVSLGTETDGSIICPSSANAVVGIKPTVGLTSRAGVIPISNRQDTVGPICRTVSDAVYVLDEIVGYDARDHKATKSASTFIPKGGYKQFLKANGLQGKRLGIVRDPFFPSDEGSNEAIAFDKHLAVLRRRGATLVDNLTISNIRTILSPLSGEETVSYHEFKHYINIYLSALLHSPVRTLADIIAFNEYHAVEEKLPEYGQDVFLMAQNTSGLNAEIYKEALERASTLTEKGIDKLLKNYELDAVVSPSYAKGISISSVLAIAGYPGISVPAGYNEGVPFGICFAAGRGSEPTLIEIAYAFEQATKIRKIPTFSYLSQPAGIGYECKLQHKITKNMDSLVWRAAYVSERPTSPQYSTIERDMCVWGRRG